MSSHWIYATDTQDKNRYVLGERGERILACLGINPSTARPEQLDNTLQSVKRIAAYNGYDGWVMFNVYPKRATNPKDLPKRRNKQEIITNLAWINKSLEELEVAAIWLAYGDLLESRPYLKDCLRSILLLPATMQRPSLIIGTPTQKGHPRHPLYKPTKSELRAFDVASYAARM